MPIGLKDSRGKDIYVGDKPYDKNYGLFIVINENTSKSVEENQKKTTILYL